MKRLIFLILAYVVTCSVATAQSITVSNYDFKMPYKNTTLYSVSPSTYSIGVSSTGQIKSYRVGSETFESGRYSIDIPLSKYADNDIHCVNVNLADGSHEHFFFTTLNEFAEDDKFIYGLDSSAKTAKVIGAKGNPVYASVPGTVSVGSFVFKVTELSSYSFSDEKNLVQIRTGENVETVKEIHCAGEYREYISSRFVTLVCDKSVRTIQFRESNEIGRIIFLGDNPPMINSRYAVPKSFVPNNSYSINDQIVYPNLPNMFESEGIMYVPTDMSERKCDILDWSESALETEDLAIGGTVNYRGIDFTVDNIAYGGLAGLPKLKNLEAGNAGEIGYGAFTDCPLLETANIHNGGNVDGYVFADCSSLKRVSFSNKGNVGECPIRYTACEVLTYENEGNIGSNRYCNAPLTEVTLRNTGDTSSEIFKGITTLKKAVVANGGKLGDFAFEGCTELASVELGDVSEVGFGAFKGCTSLRTVATTGVAGVISGLAFKGCASLTGINLEEGLTKIGDGAFEGCSSLTDVVIPGTVLTVGFDAFNGCTSLANVDFRATRFEKNVSAEDAEIKVYGPISAIVNGTKEAEYTLKKGETLSGLIYVNKASYDRSPKIKVTLNGKVVFDKDVSAQGVTKYPLLYKATRDESVKLVYTVSNKEPSSGAEIGSIWSYPESLPNGALAFMSEFADSPLKNVNIDRQLVYKRYGKSLTSPFWDNTSLETLNIGNEVVELTPSMFKGCSALKNCNVGNEIKEIPTMTFSGCGSLESFSIGSSIESLGVEAFAGCTSIVDFYAYPVVPPVCGSDALTNINKWECKLHVQPVSLEAYKEADQWKEFFFIQSDLSGVEEIADGAGTEPEGGYRTGIYTQDGVCISEEYDEEVLNKLPKGMYIANGKKILKLK